MAFSFSRWMCRDKTHAAGVIDVGIQHLAPVLGIQKNIISCVYVPNSGKQNYTIFMHFLV